MKKIALKNLKNQKGFTLVEIIVSLILVGVIAALAGTALVPFLEGYFVAKDNAEITQKAQVAMARMVKEFTLITAVSAGSNTSISFTSQHAGGPENHTISWAGSAGDPLLLDNDTLTDAVDNFQLTYIYYTGGGTEVSENTWTVNSQGIQISLRMTGAAGLQYRARVFPRNI